MSKTVSTIDLRQLVPIRRPDEFIMASTLQLETLRQLGVTDEIFLSELGPFQASALIGYLKNIEHGPIRLPFRVIFFKRLLLLSPILCGVVLYFIFDYWGIPPKAGKLLIMLFTVFVILVNLAWSSRSRKSDY